MCGTETCPLFDLDDSWSDEARKYAEDECFCQTDEYVDMVYRSDIFHRAWPVFLEVKAGMMLHPDLQDHRVRHAVGIISQEMNALENWRNKQNKPVGE